ncbi:MAG: LamG-like jellyroll fold domain-containing protein [Cyanobacteria bacterium P01_F01_bin.150]
MNNVTSSGEFIDTQVANGFLLPTDMAFLPDGRMLVLEKGGTIKIVEDPTVPSSAIETYMDLSSQVLDQEERGLLAIEVDPNFETNGYFYLFYTNDNEDRTTVSRFQHVENVGNTSSRGIVNSETVLWQEHDVSSSCCHQGGGLAIAYEPSGANDPSPYKIYITVGEEFDGPKSQDLSHDDGKVHRINLTDGSIPIDNPYYEAATAGNYTPQVDTRSSANSQGVLQTIYSYGLRNPFRASYDQESQTLFIGEVGGNSNNRAKEDIHIAAPGANHGWPTYEGFFNPTTDPGNPIHSYPHLNGPGQGEIPLFGPNGASVTGGVVYRGDDFPDQYQGAYFYGDWVRNWIRYLELDYSGDRPVVVEDHFFKNATGQVLAFEEGPDGSLYYLTTFQTGNVFTFQGAVNRLDWSQSNSAPTGTGILLSPDELESSTANHTVTFDADVTDPDGDALSYQWSFGDGADLDGDGVGDTATSTDPNPTHTYTEKGEYTVELVVTDSNGAATVFDSKQIIVGQRPEVTIATPLEGGLFRAGDTLTFTGSAIDPEDGVLSGNSVVWSAVFLHNEHTHPGIAGVANQAGGITFEIEDFGHDYSSNTGYEVFLTATDSDGISTTQSVVIRPDKVDVTFDAPVDNYLFALDGLTRKGDFIHDTVINFRHTIEAQASYVDQGFDYIFSHWADDVTNTNPVRTFVVPEQDITFQPVYGQGNSVNDALALNGTGGVSVPNLVVGQDNGNFTVEAWVKFAPGDSINNVDGLISSGTLGNGNDLNFYAGRFRLYNSISGDVVIANHQSQADVWIHYAIARENGVMKVYVDGQLDISQSTTWSDPLSIEQIGTGVLAGGLNGQLDELRIWSVARSQIDIDANKDMRIDGATAGLERYYQFDGGIVDVTGQSASVSLPSSAQLVPSTAPLTEPVVNLAPVAVNDTATVVVGSTTHLHILDNDYDPDGFINPQAVEILSSPRHGTLEMMDTHAELDERGLGHHHFGHAEYTPNEGFTGVDTFIYRVQDNEGAWSNPATMVVRVNPTTPTPTANQSLSLDGTGGIDVENLTLSGDFTIESWVKFAPDDSINNIDGLISAGAFGNGNDLNFYAGKARIYSSSYGFGNDPVIARQASQTGQWQHYAFVRENGIARVYIDGVLDATSPNTWTGDFTVDQIGTAVQAGGLNGEMDELRIWSVARSQTDIDANKGLSISGSTAGLERYYTFDEGIVDVTGNSSDAALPSSGQLITSTAPIPNTPVTPPPHHHNQVLTLDGNGGVDVENLTLSGDFTIESWVKFSADDLINNQDGILTSGTFGNGNDLNFYAGKARVYSSSYGFGNDPVIANQPSQTAQWQHYAFVRENGVTRVYVDGVLDATSPNEWTGDFTVDQIGTAVQSGGLNGAMDELRIWSVARSQAEIASNMRSGVSSNSNGLERYYQFEGGVIDMTGKSSTATLPNNVQITNAAALTDF